MWMRRHRNPTQFLMLSVGGLALFFACDSAPTVPTPPDPLPDLAMLPPVDMAVLPPDLSSYPAPVVTSVSPTTGANNVSTAITITGQNFRSGATVTVGGQVCASPTVLSSTTIGCTVPAKAATCTAQNVVVTHPDDMKSATGTGLFAYRTGTLGFVTGAPANYPTGAFPRRIVSADFNGDGNSDLALANQNGNSVTVMLGSANGTFPAATIATYPLPAGATSPQDLVAVDLNGDNKIDLALANTSNNVSVLLNNGTAFTGTNYATGIQGSAIAAGDISADGKVDLVVGQANGTAVLALLNNAAGSGVFSTGPTRTVAGTVADLALADA